jgi:hypothetical protein
LEGKNTLISPFLTGITDKRPISYRRGRFFLALKLENQYPKEVKERNCLERLSSIISPDAGILVLVAQFFPPGPADIFWLRQVDLSFCAEPWEVNPIIRMQEATRAATKPGSIHFFFFISAGFVI